MYRHRVDERAGVVELWVRRKRGNRKLVCSGCGGKFEGAHDFTERAVRDLPWGVFRTTVYVEVYRVKCPKCGVKTEKVPLLPSKAPFSERFEDAVGILCSGTSVRRVAQQLGLPESTVRAIDLRFLERWEARRSKPALRQMGVDEIYLGRKQGFVTVVSNLETAEPVWFGRGRQTATLDGFFEGELSEGQRAGIEAACMDMWRPFRMSTGKWAPNCRIVYDKFHVLQHANKALDEVRRTEFFRKGKEKRELVKGKRWLLLRRWVNLSPEDRGQLNALFAINKRLFKAHMLKESLDRLWNFTTEDGMCGYLQRWIDQLRWQRLPSFKKLAAMLLDHLDGILNYCSTKVRLGVVEAVNGNIKAIVRRGRGYRNLRYLLLKAQHLAATKTEFITLQKTA